MNGNIYMVETLDPKDFDEWVGHCDSVFGVGADYFRRHFVSDPYRDYDSVFIIKDQAINKIISTVRVFHRQVYIGGKVYKMGGIGEVSTHPDYRGLGLSYKLLEAAAAYMKKNRFDLSMLGTGRYSHYEKHGFMRASFYKKNVDADLEITNADIRPLTSENFHEMSGLYDKYCAGLNGCIVRSKEYWREWCAVEIKNPYGLFRDNQLTGYICFEGDKVGELAAGEKDHDILLSAVKPENGKISVPAFVKTQRAVFEEYSHDGTMICVFNPIEIDGIVLKDTTQTVEYLNTHGGIVRCGQDSF